ncbi:putative RNA-binding protein [Methanococcus maripaludis]|uniref:Putative RNA-binding protein n=1 Tax=Methanococcus maripaludis TaxID=39152 RepID=A0A7J9PJY0_METMI|nr:putative RNA-binding protein [Methanococcus maripaludis]
MVVILTNYFMCITNEENWNVVKDKKVWGVSEMYKNTIAKVEKGDMLLIYEMGITGKEPKPQYIRGLYEVTSDVNRDGKKIFGAHPRNPNETYPLRVKLKEIEVFESPILFKPLVEKLEFIKNKKQWSGSLRRAMVPLNEKDFNTIRNGK